MSMKGFRPGLAAAILGLALSGCSEMYSHDDFVNRVKDKSESEVVAEVGKPASVDKSDPARVTLTYLSRTFGTGTQTTLDKQAIVVLTPAAPGGPLKVSDVLFK